MSPWIPKTFDAACKRAAGRRRYHAERRRARDKRQLVILAVLVDLKWQSYGVGRVLADSLSVDPATISRDIQYLHKWRTSLIDTREMTESLADAIIRRLVVAGIHPRHGYSWTYVCNAGVSSLTVQRGFRSPRGSRKHTRLNLYASVERSDEQATS
jgi:hypothetical protein